MPGVPRLIFVARQSGLRSNLDEVPMTAEAKELAFEELAGDLLPTGRPLHGIACVNTERMSGAA